MPVASPQPKPMDPKTLARVAEYLITARRQEAVRHSEIHEWVKDRVLDIYIPSKANAEFRKVAETSRWNFLPTLLDNVCNRLFIDGYRGQRETDNKPVWDKVWQPNRMDARQSGIWRPAAEFGTSYATVVPGEINGEKTAIIKPWSPRRLTALYEDPINDEWAAYFMTVGFPRPEFTADGHRMVTPVAIYDGRWRYEIDVDSNLLTTVVYQVFQRPGYAPPAYIPEVSVDAERARVREHGMDVAPVVRFQWSMAEVDDGPEGIVWPMLPAQRQVNQTTFNEQVAELYSAFRQKWVVGLPIQEDENGNPIEPFNVAVDRLLQAEDHEVKFGDFEQTDLKGYLDSRDKTLLFVASKRHQPPHTMVVGDSVANVSAEALAALQDGQGRDVDAAQTSLGESGEGLLRLAGKAMGDDEAWRDMSSQVRWRDTTPRSLAQVADALGKLAQMVGVPPRGLWERIPGVTDQDLSTWEKLAKEDDSFAKLDGLVNDARSRRQPVDQGASGAPIGGR